MTSQGTHEELILRRLYSTELEFDAQLDGLLQRDADHNAQVESQVRDIIQQVRLSGDKAVLSYTEQFDHVAVECVDQLIVGAESMQQAYEQVSVPLQQALRVCAERIRRYHEHQLRQDWMIDDECGNRLGQRLTPLDRVGLYVPGGKAAYPSSVLMNAIPAQVAGVSELVMVVPAPGGVLNPLVLAAAHVAGIDELYQIGGAQAVAALAYGTETIQRVDKIVGPGNQYVATAKRLVFGQVGIDMVAGPSEVLVVADHTADPMSVALDLFAQAEHDEQAQAILVSTEAAVLEGVCEVIQRLLPDQPRADIIRQSLNQFGAFIQVPTLADAFDVVNRMAPEHLELVLENAEQYLPEVRHAGAIFLGHYSAEALGDYCLGPSHVLPTAGSARFSSPLGVDDFQKRSSIIHCSAKGAREVAPLAVELANAEQLFAHAASAKQRLR